MKLLSIRITVLVVVLFALTDVSCEGLFRKGWRYPNGLKTASSFGLTPRAMVKFGALYLNNGNWNDEQIIASEWVKESSMVYRNNAGIKLPIENSGINTYGYTWWISELNYHGKPLKIYRGNGWRGQTIMVIPELDMVVVFTSETGQKKSKLFKLINDYILPSVNN